MNTILELQKRIKETYSIDTNYIEGDGTEFGEPHKLTYKLPTGGLLELDVKLGNSWYFPGCCGVDLITIGTKLNYKWFNNQFRFIDQTGDIEDIWKWIQRVWGKDANNNSISDLVKDRSRVFYGLGKRMLDRYITDDFTYKVGTPKTMYTLIDQDTLEEKDYKVIDVTLPYPSNEESMNLIIQGCAQDNKLYYSFRALTKSKTPDLIRIDPMKELPEYGFNELIQNWKLLVDETFR